ncbi:MAG: VanW family protein [Candidatus Riflebacteria bacterium]|nr:VanW family protein [Candidatus Riflebacteria bacterium]
MKNFLLKLVAILGLSLFLFFIFVGVKKLQTSPTPTPQLENPKNTEIPHMTQMQKSIETKTVDIVFKMEKGELKFPAQPIVKVEKMGEQVVDYTLDKQFSSNLVKQIPVPQVSITDKQLEPFKSKNPSFKFIQRPFQEMAVDQDATIKALELAIKQNPSQTTQIISPVLVSSNPEKGFDSERIRNGFQTELSSFSTVHIDHSKDEGRNVNLAVAAGKIDGLILQPGEEFDFDKIVGPRTRKNGFQMAGVISGGKVIPGMGGGVCQVSTTIYRTALLANLKIIERHNHSIYEGIPYADRGLDSAISWGSKNLKFKNSLDTPILISCLPGEGQVFTVFYGLHKPFDKVEVRTKNEVPHPFSVVKTRNPREVRPGVTGYTVESYRVVIKNGQQFEEFLGKDNYQMFPQVTTASN